ncbi:MAG: valine--tRNA ligase [Desulfohalobiaceae bacterium]|nr:valine--tRNA ligase [Desulfohalobiaceae bacterium]
MAEARLPKGYEPDQVEDTWLDFWEKQQSFTPGPDDDREPYTIVIPPPNVTGSLHMGHALNLTLQDILCRYARQKGYNVLWIPGTDHAGIATQNVVERALAAEGISRQDLGREKFVERVWQWKEEYGDKILNQIRKLGASVDWSRLRFTMDNGLSRAVREVFVSLYEQGLIYRGNYITNWCPRCRTALSDLEVEHHEKKGGLYSINYQFADGEGALTVVTTRPETMLGDTAVAVHPEDERYRDSVGRMVELPLTGRRIPVIADIYVDSGFGSGCLKVTPAHDPNDFELGQRHGLDSIRVIDDEGRMTKEVKGAYAGLDRFECRKMVVQDLKAAGLLVKQEEYLHKVGHCYRCRTVIEPNLSRQWFVAVGPLAEKAKKAVVDGDSRIFPANWNRLYFDWLDDIRDWCISRQIWWGHRIPAWTCAACNELIVSREDPKVCPACGRTDLIQDEDVLDTWFSSALWPFSTLGWPDRTRDLEVFYPTKVLVTGFDIIFFWVARMMMMGLEFMHEVPFRDIYIHALVRDEQGRKMSKSTGNVIDPLLMIERYGADALRFTLTAFAAMGRDIKLAEARIQGYKHFINKIWNAARFALMNLEEGLEADDRWREPRNFSHAYILHELEQVKKSVSRSLNGYQFNEAAQTLYQFVWHTYCDWYLEMIKPELYSGDEETRKTAASCLEKTFSELIVLMHPLIPFVTQEIWDKMPGRQGQDLSGVDFPEQRPWCEDQDLEKKMDFFQELVVGVRNIRSELNINPARKLDVLLLADGDDAGFLRENEDVILQLAGIRELQIDPGIGAPQAAASGVVKGYEFFVPLAGVIDFQAEIQRLDKELSKIQKNMEGLNRKLSNENFLNKAPDEVVEKEKAKLGELQEKRQTLERLQSKLARLDSQG